MKNFWKVALAALAVVGIAKLAKDTVKKMENAKTSNKEDCLF